MEVHQKPKATPAMILKVVGLANSMALGFGAAFYAGYNSLPYVLVPCIFLEISCSSCFVLIRRYLMGTLFQGQNPNTMKGAFWLGCVMLAVSIVGCFVFGITGFVKIEGFVYKAYGLYAALVPCLLAVVWSCVLVYDAKYYWRLWQRELGNRMAGNHIIFRP
ncbi:unnamed protein product [Larinioides sclopetarius]|uniref:Uncharacterized protein n=1 Tax=Larinioides sclopetarius TaxID=280406 RepID=A0AAV2BUI0_9ARAC